MTLTINGVDFNEDAETFDAEKDYASDSTATAGSSDKYPTTSRGPVDSASMTISVPATGNNPNTVSERLSGLLSDEVWLVEASDQQVLGTAQKVYMSPTSDSVEQEPGVPGIVRFEVEANILGVPVDEGGPKYMGFFQGGRVEPIEWDKVYFPLDTASRKGVKPSSSEPFDWVQRSTNHWTDADGTWNVKRTTDDEWVLREESGSGYKHTIYEDFNSFSDGCFQAQVKPADAYDSSLLFRWQGNAADSGGYIVGLSGDANEVRLIHHDGTNSSAESTVDSYSQSINTSRWYNLSVVGTGSRLKVYLDGEQVINNEESRYSSGYAGHRVAGQRSEDPEFKHGLLTEMESTREMVGVTHQNVALVLGQGANASWPLGSSTVDAVRTPQDNVLLAKEALT